MANANCPTRTLGAAGAVVLVEVDDALRVGAGLELMALRLELCSERLKIEDLAVEDDPYRLVSFDMGWAPPERSMMLRRRWPRATGPSV
jgi:hypothetical protein